MAELLLRPDLVARLETLARAQQRTVDEVVETLLEAAAVPQEVLLRRDPAHMQTWMEMRPSLFQMARDYWQQVGDTERLSLSDAALEEQFWLFDDEGIPRLIADYGKVVLAPDPLERVEGKLEHDVTDLSQTIRQSIRKAFPHSVTSG
jgi:hypothetical protein